MRFAPSFLVSVFLIAVGAWSLPVARANDPSAAEQLFFRNHMLCEGALGRMINRWRGTHGQFQLMRPQNPGYSAARAAVLAALYSDYPILDGPSRQKIEMLNGFGVRNDAGLREFTIGRWHPHLTSMGPQVSLQIQASHSGRRYGKEFSIQLEPGDISHLNLRQIEAVWNQIQHVVGHTDWGLIRRPIERDYHANGVVYGLYGLELSEALALLFEMDRVMFPPDFLSNHRAPREGFFQYFDPQNPDELITRFSTAGDWSVVVQGQFIFAIPKDKPFTSIVEFVFIGRRLNVLDLHLMVSGHDKGGFFIEDRESGATGVGTVETLPESGHHIVTLGRLRKP